MMNKNFILICYTAISCILSFSIMSCIKTSTDSIAKPEIKTQTRIKRKLLFDYIKDTIPRMIFKYQYDNEMKLEKIDHYFGSNPDRSIVYESFEYSTDKLIVRKLTYDYVDTVTGWKIADSTSYTYKEKILISEKTYFPLSSDYIYYKYEYKNSQLIKTTKFNNQVFEYYISYEYFNNNCIKERMFTDSLGKDLYDFTNHQYENNMLIKSEIYLSNNYKIQEIFYTYDEVEKLIIEESKKVDLTIVKPLNYVARYEYY